MYHCQGAIWLLHDPDISFLVMVGVRGDRIWRGRNTFVKVGDSIGRVEDAAPQYGSGQCGGGEGEEGGSFHGDTWVVYNE